MNDLYANRRGLTFGQAEGVEKLPQQLALREVSKELRAKLHLVIMKSLSGNYEYNQYGADKLGGAWAAILMDHHINYRHGFIDEYSNHWDERQDQQARTMVGRVQDAV